MRVRIAAALLFLFVVWATTANATSYTVTRQVDCSGSAWQGCVSNLITALETTYAAKLYARSSTDTVHGYVNLSQANGLMTVAVTFYDVSEAPNQNHTTTFQPLASLPSGISVYSTVQAVPLP